MTVAEILEQAEALSQEERKELAKRLIDMIDTNLKDKMSDIKAGEPWGESVTKLISELDVGLKYPEIEDPVEWVKHLRSEEQKRRLGDWVDAE